MILSFCWRRDSEDLGEVRLSSERDPVFIFGNPAIVWLQTIRQKTGLWVGGRSGGRSTVLSVAVKYSRAILACYPKVSVSVRLVVTCQGISLDLSEVPEDGFVFSYCLGFMIILRMKMPSKSAVRFF